MAAFSPYAGEYEWAGKRIHWRCYATAPVYGLRIADHGSTQQAPTGRRWVALQMRSASDPAIQCLLDETVYNFSQILTQVDSDGRAQAVSAAGSMSDEPTLAEAGEADWPANVSHLHVQRARRGTGDSEIPAVA